MLYIACNLFVYFSSMLNVTSNNSPVNNFINSIVDKLALISDLNK